MAKTYTAPGTVAAGDVYTAAAHNIIATDVSNFIVPAMCVLTGFNASQSFAHGVAAGVQFNGADIYDTDAMHDTVTNNTRMTITTAGLYMVTFTAQINSTGVTQLSLWLRKDGVSFAENNSAPLAASAARGNVSSLQYFTSGQYVEAFLYQESAASAARNLASAQFNAVWVGRAA